LMRSVSIDEKIDPFHTYRSFQKIQLFTKERLLLAALCFAALEAVLISSGNSASAIYALYLSPIVVIGGILQLKSSFHKVRGEVIFAALNDIGLMYAVIAVAVVLSSAFGQADLAKSLTILFVILALLISAYAIYIYKIETKYFDSYDYRSGNTILFNSLFIYLYRNGYPIVFSFFMDVREVGQFRLEERLGFAVMFAYSILEIFAMKRIVAGISGSKDQNDIKKLFLKYSKFVVLFSVIVALIIYYSMSVSAVRNVLGIEFLEDTFIFIILGSVLHILGTFCILFLNLNGKFRLVPVQIICASSIFILGGALLFWMYGPSGLRIAYFLSGAVSAVLGTGVILLLRWNDDTKIASENM